jgi:hypothetical protein
VVVYIDDILVYSNSVEEHVEHLQKVFQRLKENKLYAKFDKCEFGVSEVDFLGHRITQEGLKMDNRKVKAILDWEPPRSMSQPHFEGVVKSPLTLPKMGLGSPLGFSKTQSVIAGAKTPCIESLSISLEKVLKCRCLKWPCMSHLDIFSTSYGKKKCRESN